WLPLPSRWDHGDLAGIDHTPDVPEAGRVSRLARFPAGPRGHGVRPRGLCAGTHGPEGLHRLARGSELRPALRMGLRAGYAVSSVWRLPRAGTNGGSRLGEGDPRVGGDRGYRARCPAARPAYRPHHRRGERHAAVDAENCTTHAGTVRPE